VNAVTVRRELSVMVERVQIDISPNTWMLIRAIAKDSGKSECAMLDELVLDRLKSICESRGLVAVEERWATITPAEIAADLAPRPREPGAGDAAAMDACLDGLGRSGR
jgi:hypothetical protein